MNAKLWSRRIWVTPQALRAGSYLIGRLKIRPGQGLAPYLDVEPFYNNFEAVYLWTERVLVLNAGKTMTGSQLVSRFLDLIPESAAGELT